MQLGRVFISSVFGGMLDLRDIAAQAARLVGLEPVLTEHHVAQSSSVRDALLREIEACDTYVGLFNVGQLNQIIRQLESPSPEPPSAPLTLGQKLRATLSRWFGR